jgi:hypothetical protein
MHAGERARSGLFVDSLLQQRSNNEPLEVPIGQALDVNDYRLAWCENADVERMARASLKAEDARAFVDDPTQTSVEPAQCSGVVARQ